jgi:hypothetical protein
LQWPVKALVITLFFTSAMAAANGYDYVFIRDSTLVQKLDWFLIEGGVCKSKF